MYEQNCTGGERRDKRFFAYEKIKSGGEQGVSRG
jgi:hypothetical protein